MTGWLNEKPWEHVSKNGTIFYCSCCDFRDIVFVKKSQLGCTEIQLMEDVTEMIGWHGVNIHKCLNGFSGYDTLRFQFVDSHFHMEWLKNHWVSFKEKYCECIKENKPKYDLWTTFVKWIAEIHVTDTEEFTPAQLKLYIMKILEE